MINKICTIATNNGSPLDITDNGINGLLFDRTAEDLASKMDYIYKNPDIKKSLAQAEL